MSTDTLPRTVVGLRAIRYTMSSRTMPGRTYTTWVDAQGWHCTCPARVPCWHIREAVAGNGGTPTIDADRGWTSPPDCAASHPRRSLGMTAAATADARIVLDSPYRKIVFRPANRQGVTRAVGVWAELTIRRVPLLVAGSIHLTTPPTIGRETSIYRRDTHDCRVPSWPLCRDTEATILAAFEELSDDDRAWLVHARRVSIKDERARYIAEMRTALLTIEQADPATLSTEHMGTLYTLTGLTHQLRTFAWKIRRT